MVELEILGAAAEQVAQVVSVALDTAHPEDVVSIGRTLDGGVRVAAGEPLSPRQRTALAAIKERWPAHRGEDNASLSIGDRRAIVAAC